MRNLLEWLATSDTPAPQPMEEYCHIGGIDIPTARSLSLAGRYGHPEPLPARVAEQLKVEIDVYAAGWDEVLYAHTDYSGEVYARHQAPGHCVCSFAARDNSE
jgi:hypothetical protein